MIPRTHLKAPPHFYPNSNWLEQHQDCRPNTDWSQKVSMRMPRYLPTLMHYACVSYHSCRLSTLIPRIQDSRPYSQHLPSLLALKDWWDKSNVTWFLRGQTSYKICQYKKSQSNLFILDNRKWTTIYRYLKDINDKFWIGVFIVTFLDTVMTVGE